MNSERISYVLVLDYYFHLFSFYDVVGNTVASQAEADG